MNFCQFLSRFICFLSCSEIIFSIDHNIAWANEYSNHKYIIESSIYSQKDVLETQSRLEESLEIVKEMDDSQLKVMILEEIGEKELAQNIFKKSETIIAELSHPLAQFPFQESPSNFKLGISGTINSYRDTTALLGVDVDFAKQWTQDYIFIDGSVYIDYDSSRSVNNYRILPQKYTEHLPEH
jgi:hypothetical protein